MSSKACGAAGLGSALLPGAGRAEDLEAEPGARAMGLVPTAEPGPETRVMGLGPLELPVAAAAPGTVLRPGSQLK